MLQRRKKILIDRIDLAVERLFARLVGREARALFSRVGQFAEGVGELKPADIELEPLGEAGILGFAAG